MRAIVEVTEGAGHTRKKACVAQTNYSIRGFEGRASKKVKCEFYGAATFGVVFNIGRK